MLPLRRHLRSFTWLALWVMAGLAVGPTVSRSLSHVRSEGGATPMAMLAAPSATADAHQHHQHQHPHGGHDGAPAGGEHDHLNHCPLCGIAATAWALAPAVAVPVVASARATTVLRVAVPAPRELAVWGRAQPRGPPAFS